MMFDPTKIDTSNSVQQPIRWQRQALSVCALLWMLAMLQVGCTRSPYGVPPAYPVAPGYGAPQYNAPAAGQQAAAGPNSVYAQQQTHPQLVELQQRVQQLDENNRKLTTQYAQVQQQAQAYRERAELYARQLDDATQKYKELYASSQQYASQARDLQQSMTARGGARLTANNSLSGSAGNLQIGGVRVVPDGDLIRLRVPADQLFSPGTAQLSQAGLATLDQVGSALTRQYPKQRVGIEGHTDNAPLYGGTTAFQLAGAQAQAVMDQLVRRTGVPTGQLFFIAHGSNHPVADNQSPAGRAENRRIEIVVYPETY